MNLAQILLAVIVFVLVVLFVIPWVEAEAAQAIGDLFDRASGG